MNVAGWCLACAGVAWSQPGFSSFDDVKQRVLSEADRLPNYTCTETMEQYRRLAHTKTFEMTERFRLTARSSGGREEFRRRTLRYDYNVLVEQSSLHLSVANQHMITGYHGSFWVDPDLHLLELDAILEGFLVLST